MTPAKPRVFIDADVLYAGAFSPRDFAASEVVLRMGEITLIDAITSEQVITEVTRNLTTKAPAALPTFHFLVSRCLRVVPNPTVSAVQAHRGRADAKDLPILVAALREGCGHLVTFNLRHFHPGHPQLRVLRPSAFLTRIRLQLGQIG